jgi:hypothetical protein
VSSGGVFALMVMVVCLLGVVEQAEHAPREVPLEGAERLRAGASHAEPSLSERLRLRADAELGDRDPVQRGIQLPVAATVQPMALHLA